MEGFGAPEGAEEAGRKVFEPSAPLIAGQSGRRVLGGERRPAVDAALRGGGEAGSWTAGSARRRQAVPVIGRGGGAALSRALPGLHGRALPRASHQGSRLRLGYTWLKLRVVEGRCRKARAKGPPEEARRRPLPGMMLHQDGSRHAWLAGRPPLDLIVTMDDATGAIYSAFLTEEEGTASTSGAQGGFLGARPADEPLHHRGAHFFHTPKAGGEVDRGHPTRSSSPRATRD